MQPFQTCFRFWLAGLWLLGVSLLAQPQARSQARPTALAPLTAPMDLPRLVAQPKAGTYLYAATMMIDSMRSTSLLKRVVKEEGDTWVITKITSDVHPNSDGTLEEESTTLAKGSLAVLRHRTAKLALAYAGAKIRGTLREAGDSYSVEYDLGGSAFADGAALEESIACLPLAEGFHTRFWTLNLRSQKGELLQAKVVTQERVEVPAGRFQAWKVELAAQTSPEARLSIWVDQASRRVLKTFRVWSEGPFRGTEARELQTVSWPGPLLPAATASGKAADTDPVPLPRPVAQPTQGASTYAGRLALQIESNAVTFASSRTRTIRDEGDSWSIVEEDNPADPGLVNRITLFKSTLAPRSWVLKQAKGFRRLAYEGTRVTGAGKWQGVSHDLDVELGTPPFAEGPAREVSIACLPLAEGFHTSFRALAWPSGKVQVLHVVVVAQEAVTVPAGTFRAWKVEVSSATDDTDLLVLWVDQASRRVLKSVQSGPVLAGGTLTLELQS